MSYEESRARGVAAFVRDTGRDEYWRTLAEFRATLLDERGRVRTKLVEAVSCAACGSREHRLAFEKDGFDYVRCTGCGSLYITPQLREGVLNDFWGESPVSAHWLDVLLAPAQVAFDRAKFGRTLARLERERGGPGRVLDIGCSIGSFLDVARSRGWEVAGSEPGAHARKLAADRFGLELHERLEDVDGVFDVVTFWEVVEHVKDPAGLLRAAASRLTERGMLVTLVGGSAGSLANRVMRGSSAAFDFARLWYFTPSSFEMLLATAGLLQFDAEPVLAEVDTFMNYLRYDDPYDPTVTEQILPTETIEALQRAATTVGCSYKFLSYAQIRG